MTEALPGPSLLAYVMPWHFPFICIFVQISPFHRHQTYWHEACPPSVWPHLHYMTSAIILLPKKSHIGGTLWLDFSISFGENEIPPGTWPLWRSHFIKEGENSLLSKEVDLGLRQIKPLICGVRNNPSNFCLDKQLLCFGFWTYPKNPRAEGLVPSRWYYWESKDHLGGVA